MDQSPAQHRGASPANREFGVGLKEENLDALLHTEEDALHPDAGLHSRESETLGHDVYDEEADARHRSGLPVHDMPDTPEEGGDVSKIERAKDVEFGHGNKIKDTMGATLPS